ncbi:DsrE family protein [Carboxylicivirga sp. M1479]|uniref:DsrE family protein n=2 Tax=Carboxylicivirga TaxID=1628153 RepID=UPI00117897F4|nr:DsrE family protein [Carboxylicivirga sp. M1479]TRX61093.1 DsrE family protein [Carboxylicivirga sp. M1479]
MDKINILWTTTNRDTISKMISMYSVNAVKNGWWDEVNVIIWGASAQLLGENAAVQAEVKEMIAGGVHVEACQACADQFGVSDKIKSLGVDVRYMGEPLTAYLKNNEKVLTI